MDAISYTEARNSLSAVMARVTENHKPLIITPRKGKATVLMALEDFNSWQETSYLTRSPANRFWFSIKLSPKCNILKFN
jgi:antitoxin YefM